MNEQKKDIEVAMDVEGGKDSTTADAQRLFIVGDQSGVGKSTIALGLLGMLLKLGYKPSELAYIKPCTQCEEVQLVAKFCEKHGIAHNAIGPVRFYAGFTAEVIEGKDDGVASRHKAIRTAVDAISVGKKLVLVDGVGYAAVGSVAGVSNGQVAQLLGTPAIVIGRAGIGNAIDSFNFIMAYLEKYHVTVLGALFNNIPKEVTYHTFDSCKKYVSMYFARELPTVSMYGFVPRNEEQWKQHALEGKKVVEACIIKHTKQSLQMSEEEEKLCADIVDYIQRFVDVQLLVQDVDKYYKQRRAKTEALTSE